MFLINLCLSFYGPALPFSHLSWEDMSIGEIIFKSVLELWEGTITKAPEIIINHLNETLIRSCVHYSTQEGSRPTQIFSWWYFKWQWYHSSCHLSKKWFSCQGKKKICSLLLEIQFPMLAVGSCCPIQPPSLPFSPQTSPGQLLHWPSPRTVPSLPHWRGMILGLHLKGLWSWLSHEGMRSTNVHFLEKGFLGIRIPPSQKSLLTPLSSSCLSSPRHAIALRFPSGLTVQNQSLICSTGSALHLGCQESGALAEGGQAERKRYITAAALRHDVRVWKLKKAWDGETGRGEGCLFGNHLTQSKSNKLFFQVHFPSLPHLSINSYLF